MDARLAGLVRPVALLLAALQVVGLLRAVWTGATGPVAWPDVAALAGYLAMALVPGRRGWPEQLAGPGLVIGAVLTQATVLARGPSTTEAALPWLLVAIGFLGGGRRWAAVAALLVLAAWLVPTTTGLADWPQGDVGAMVDVGAGAVAGLAIHLWRIRRAVLARTSLPAAWVDASTGLRNATGLAAALAPVVAADAATTVTVLVVRAPAGHPPLDASGWRQAVARTLAGVVRAHDVPAIIGPGAGTPVVLLAPGSTPQVAASRLARALGAGAEVASWTGPASAAVADAVAQAHVRADDLGLA